MTGSRGLLQGWLCGSAGQQVTAVCGGSLGGKEVAKGQQRNAVTIWVTISGLPVAACRGVSCGIMTDFLAEVARERPTWPGAVCFRSQSLPDLLSLQIYV